MRTHSLNLILTTQKKKIATLCLDTPFTPSYSWWYMYPAKSDCGSSAGDWQPWYKTNVMTQDEENYEMRDEYDFSKGIRNPYVQRFQELNLVSLDADVKAVFPDSDAVNSALRLLIKAGKEAQQAVQFAKAS